MIEKKYTLTRHGNRLKLNIKVNTNSSTNKIGTIKNNELIVKVMAVPEKGKANKEIIAFFAKLLHIPKAEIEIISGIKSTHKAISFPLATEPVLKKIIGL